MITRTVRLPSDLIKQIDAQIEDKNFSTYGDFVLTAMRYTLSVYSDKRKEMIENYKSVEITPNMIAQTYRAIKDVCFQGLNKYDGDSIQINVRVPEKLDENISKLIKEEYGLKKKSDYIKVSVICLLSKIEEVNDIFEDTEKFIENQKQLMEIVYKTVMEGLSQYKSGPEIISEATRKLLENADE